jgi:putative addiction module component (TIGR02574 family)
MSTVDQLYQTIASLSETERAELIDRVCAEGQLPTIFSEQWRAEIERRASALDDGTMGRTPWEEVRAEVKAKYFGHA